MMLSQPIPAVNTQPAPPAAFHPEGTGLGVNPARHSGRIVTRTWYAHQRLVNDTPSEVVLEQLQELRRERRVGYAKFLAGQSTAFCANQSEWGGWLQAQGEYKAGRFASYSPDSQCPKSMTPAHLSGYHSGLAHQRKMEAVSVTD